MEMGFKQWTLTRGDLASQGTSGSIWRRFWLPQPGRGWELLRVSSGEDRNAAKYPTMHKMVPHNKNYTSQNANNAKFEKPLSNPNW